MDREQVCAKFAHTAKDGKTYQVIYYNLDVIISVGYRVKSKRGTNFRIWATQILRNHLIENAKRLTFGKSHQEKYLQLVRTIDIAASTATSKPLSPSEATGILKVLQSYAYALEMLDRYDHQTRGESSVWSRARSMTCPFQDNANFFFGGILTARLPTNVGDKLMGSSFYLCHNDVKLRRKSMT